MRTKERFKQESQWYWLLVFGTGVYTNYLRNHLDEQPEPPQTLLAGVYLFLSLFGVFWSLRLWAWPKAQR